MSQNWRVLKFGGTSVATAASWRRIAARVQSLRDQGDRVVVVCSALSGVTNQLLALSPGGQAAELLDSILDRHAALGRELGVETGPLVTSLRETLLRCVGRLESEPSYPARAALAACGEFLSTRLGHAFLSTMMDCEWVDAASALRTVPEDERGTARAWLSARCASGPDPDLQRQWAGRAGVLITQGYVASRPDGQVAVLGRGGSDTSAALLAGRLGVPEVEIWTDVPGLFSTNPSAVPEARLIACLDYTEALEMAAGGARVVHPRCIRAAADCNIAVRIGDLRHPAVNGTLIQPSRGVLEEASTGPKAVTSQDNMLVVLLENRDMRQQVGFLAWVFGVISDLGISVDLVATSETTTTLAINGVDNSLDEATLEGLSTRLSERCRIRLYPDSFCVNLVGRGIRTALPDLSALRDTFREWPLLMLSQSANDLCLSFLVGPEHGPKLQADLHRELVLEGTLLRHPGVYGPAWSSLAA